MGDRVQMEIKRKKREVTLAGLFTRYTVIFCVNILLIFVILIGVICLFPLSSLFLPANYAEEQIDERRDAIAEADVVTSDLIPNRCSYGVYDADGWYLYGNFADEEKEPAWKHYEEERSSAGGTFYYQYIRRESGEVCIVKYALHLQFANEKLNDHLPNAEGILIVVVLFLFVLLLLANAVLVSRTFAKVLKKRLKKLERVTKKIADQELDFEIEASDIREINTVMDSFEKMKRALKESLEQQWKLEQQKKEQMAALAHDIKTPLTVIRGHAELLAEETLPDEAGESTAYILSNVQQIEDYLAAMRQVLDGGSLPEQQERFSGEEVKELLFDIARQTAAAQGSFVLFSGEKTKGGVICDRQLLIRAFENILSNAFAYGDTEKGIRLSVAENCREGEQFLKISVHNFGRGFSKRDLIYADQEFYSGDESRHDSTHQGLGLAIVRKFAAAQGGYLEYRNEAGGAVVEVYLREK
ncbi:HAMP domain-containing histidine kinase [Roseburia sp. BX0805]|uniref:histidine kinase n=1 Tax=Roseburia yibonii TaxID=2763063 RepID=A0ABR7ICY6_9FIRM|nr:HAMP domain-containing sensor histidine kinase [Roseburia yibonii]MBC5754753.1 HAMP domain-containing histidine kinase [Roseburia yibonii]